MKFNPKIKVFGDKSFRGPCPTEASEQAAVVGKVRREYPETWGKLLIHVQNEGKRRPGQAMFAKAQGLTKGAADLIIPAAPTFVCEMKRQDHTKSRWQDGQEDYLIASMEAGAFVCIALGAVAAIEALTLFDKLNSMSYEL